MDASVSESLSPGIVHGPLPLWLRLLSRLPLSALYAVVGFVLAIVADLIRYRSEVVDYNLRLAFPDLSPTERRRLRGEYYRNFGQVIAEVIRTAAIEPEELKRRVTVRNVSEVRDSLAQGKPVLLVAAHQCNWEWMLAALSLQLGYPLDAAYKPLKNHWADVLMLKLRARFGAYLVPAKELLGEIIKRRKELRGIALVADQEPKTSEFRHWTTFLNRETAFYMGTEEIARATRYAVFFTGMRRLRKGYYEMEFIPLLSPQERLANGELTERYAKLVEAQIHAAPADWTWSHKRWKLTKSMYGESRPGT
jgi:KDO2-lipid IV(A) lauroyltransferase